MVYPVPGESGQRMPGSRTMRGATPPTTNPLSGCGILPDPVQPARYRSRGRTARVLCARSQTGGRCGRSHRGDVRAGPLWGNACPCVDVNATLWPKAPKYGLRTVLYRSSGPGRNPPGRRGRGRAQCRHGPRVSRPGLSSVHFHSSSDILQAGCATRPARSPAPLQDRDLFSRVCF